MSFSQFHWAFLMLKTVSIGGSPSCQRQYTKGYSHCLESGVTFSMRAMKFSRNSVLFPESFKSLQYSLGRVFMDFFPQEKRQRENSCLRHTSLAPHNVIVRALYYPYAGYHATTAGTCPSTHTLVDTHMLPLRNIDSMLPSVSQEHAWGQRSTGILYMLTVARPSKRDVGHRCGLSLCADKMTGINADTYSLDYFV